MSDPRSYVYRYTATKYAYTITFEDSSMPVVIYAYTFDEAKAEAIARYPNKNWTLTESS